MDINIAAILIDVHFIGMDTIDHKSGTNYKLRAVRSKEGFIKQKI